MDYGKQCLLQEKLNSSASVIRKGGTLFYTFLLNPSAIPLHLNQHVSHLGKQQLKMCFFGFWMLSKFVGTFVLFITK